MKKGLIFLILLSLLISIPAAADVVKTFSWSPDTVYVDGSPIAAADQAKIVYNVYFRPLGGAWAIAATSAPGAITWTGTVAGINRGTAYEYTMDATLNGQTSAKAPTITWTDPFLAPAVPTGFTIVK